MNRSSVLLIVMLFAVGIVLSGCPAPQKRGDLGVPAGTGGEGTVVEGVDSSKAGQMKTSDSDVSVSDDDVVIRDAFFSYNRYDLSAEGRKALKSNAKILKKQKNATIVIEGHCDDRGSTEYNIALGQRRADAAKNYLARLGVKKNRIKTKSYGEENPFCHEGTEKCWQSNRRAHFVVKY